MFHQTSGNPFEEESLPKAYYFPSLEKHLSSSQKKICLSPNKEGDHQEETSKADAKFLRESNKLEIPTREDGTAQHEVSSGSQFDESWPSTDRNVSTLSHNTPSSSSTPAERENKNPSDYLKSSSGELHEDKLSRPSTLSKYIERFRHGAPTSRDDRSLPSSGKDFWWLTPPSNTSTPKEPSDSTTSKFTLTSDEMRHNTTSTSPPRQKYGFKRSEFSRPVRETVEGMDSNSTDLLARTNQLLEQSENTLSDVSSSKSVPKPPSSWMIEKQKRLDKAAESRIPVVKPRVAPEDDILYQWRLSRRLEKAQEEVKGSHVKHFTNTATHRVAASTRGRCNAYSPDHPRYHIHSDHGKDDFNNRDNTSSKHVGMVPERALQLDKMMDRVDDVSCRDKGRVSVMHERESARCRERNELTQETRSRKLALESNVPAVCFIDKEKIPSHVHMLCDIVPCSKQMDLEAENVNVNKHDQSVSDFCKHSIESEQRPRTYCDSPDIQDPARFQEKTVIGDIVERPRTPVRSVSCHSRTSVLSTDKEKEREGSDSRSYECLHDKEKIIISSEQPPMAHVETAESDSLHRTTTTATLENKEAMNNLGTDKLPKTGKEGKSKGNSRKSVEDNNLTNLGIACPASVSHISPKRTDSGGNSGHQLPDMQNTGVIGTVIGQVISEHLFSSMSTSRRSSLSTSSVLTESENVEHQKEKTSIECEHHVEQEHTTAATSDDILFPEDDILIRLRQQADFYREHLRNINMILE